jgi:hypothetical protein
MALEKRFTQVGIQSLKEAGKEQGQKHKHGRSKT